MAASHSRRPAVLGWPATINGRRALAIWAAAVAAIALALLVALLTGGVTDGGSTPGWARAISAVFGIAALGGGVAGGVFALLAIRAGDRSGVLFLPILALAMAAFLLVGEFLIPPYD